MQNWKAQFDTWESKWMTRWRSQRRRKSNTGGPERLAIAALA
jgi:hypothetical protein